MKKIEKLISLIAVFTLLATVTVPVLAVADATYTYGANAQKLNDLGLYNGISDTEFNPDLGTALNRETGVVMLLRLLGLEGDAQEMSDEDVAEALAKFSDADEVSAYARKAVAYAVENGILNGRPDGSIDGAAPLGAKDYAKMLLNGLGYSFVDYNNAPAELSEKGGLTLEQAGMFADKELIKDDLVGISFGALNTELPAGGRLISKLVNEGVVDKKKAVNSGAMDGVISDLITEYENAPLNYPGQVNDALKIARKIRELLAFMDDPQKKAAFEQRLEAARDRVDDAYARFFGNQDPAS